MKLNKILILLVGIFCINLVSAVDLDDSLISYYKLDEKSGNAIDSVGNYDLTNTGSMTYETGLINESARASTTKYLVSTSHTGISTIGAGNFSVSLWVNVTTATSDPVLFGQLTVWQNGWGFLAKDGGEMECHIGHIFEVTSGVNLLDSNWNHIVITRNDSETNIYVDDTLELNFSGVTSYTLDAFILGGAIVGLRNLESGFDEVAIWNRSLNTSEVSELYNSGNGYEISLPASVSVVLSSPSNDDAISDVGTNFTGNYTATRLDLANATYHIWDSSGALFNATTVELTGTSNFSTVYINNFTLGTYTWNIYACADNSSSYLCSFAESNYTFKVGVTVIEETYNALTYETKSETFSINISLLTGTTLSTANLFYNGTAYAGTITDLGSDNYFAARTISVPSVAAKTNMTFYWELKLTNSSGQFSYLNSTFHNQTVEKVNIYLCNSTYNVSYLNFTVKDFDSKDEKNASFKITWNIYTGNKTSYINKSFQNTSETRAKYQFCFEPSYQNYIVDAEIEYDADGFALNYYYLNSITITNSSSLINLYLLNDSKATLTVLKVHDDTQAPLENVYIQIQSYDIGTDTYYTTSMAKTDYNGEDVAYLNWYDTFYKFILIRDDDLVQITNSSKISDTPKIFEIPLVLTYPFDQFEDITYSLTFNNLTDNFILTFSDPSGQISAGCLRVIKRSIRNDTVICDACEESASATIYCNIASYGNGTFIASFYIKGSPFKVIDTFVHLKNVATLLYEKIGKLDGSVYAFLFAGICMVMFFITPVLGVVGILLGIAGSMALGFQPINYIEFISIVVIGGLIIWLIKR